MLQCTSRFLFFPIVFVLLFMACARTPIQPVPSFDAHPVDPDRYAKKVDHLVIVLDASSSMAAPYQNHRKIDIARSVIHHLNSTMPEVDIAVTMLSFGHAESVSRETSEILLPSQTYSREALATAVDRLEKAGGPSLLHKSFEDADFELKDVDGSIAMIIISDGSDLEDQTLPAAEVLDAHHDDRMCIHTILVGDAPDGEALLKQIAQLSGCGEALTADHLRSGMAMNSFVLDNLVAAKPDSDGDGVADGKDRCSQTPDIASVDEFGCPLDTDADGVADYRDNCQDTPAGTSVDSRGCPLPEVIVPVATQSAVVTAAGTWLYNNIQFENGKAKLKPGSYGQLDEIVSGLNNQPDLMIEIQGHSDIRGAREFNIQLSEKRAQSVKAYMVSKGIEPSRLTTRGFGPDRPIASNDTVSGRAANRRVEIKPNR